MRCRWVTSGSRSSFFACKSLHASLMRVRLLSWWKHARVDGGSEQGGKICGGGIEWGVRGIT